LDQLIDTGNKALNDYYHDDLCHCREWPTSCASSGNYFFGAWDTNAFAIALPAIIAAYGQAKAASATEQASTQYAFNARSVNRSTKHIHTGGERTLCGHQATPPMDAALAASLTLCGSCR